MIQRIKNSILGYIAGDALGVPYEFETKGSFVCSGFTGNGTYNKPKGTWSDDTSIMLCLLDALCSSNESETQKDRFKRNLELWYSIGGFTCNGFFDIGIQTSESIASGFKTEVTSKMGNGALFYSMPLAFYLYDTQYQEERKEIVYDWVKITHNNPNCQNYAFILEEFFRNEILNSSILIPIKRVYQNKGDVINTTRLVIDLFKSLKTENLSLLQKLCKVVNLGEDTDTNAALVGGLLGINEELDEDSKKEILKIDWIEEKIDNFIEIKKIWKSKKKGNSFS